MQGHTTLVSDQELTKWPPLLRPGERGETCGYDLAGAIWLRNLKGGGVHRLN